MVQILERPPSFGEAIARGLGGGISQGIGQGVQFAQQMALQGLKQKKETKDLKGTYTSILDQMKGLKEYVGPTKLGRFNPFSQTAGKRSEIDTSRLTLEGLFRDLTLKGQFPKAIYERILKELPSASDTESQYLGKIRSIENILEAHFGEEKQEKSKKSSSKKVPFNISNPEHRAKRDQVLKQTGNNRQKTEEILSREFE